MKKEVFFKLNLVELKSFANSFISSLHPTHVINLLGTLGAGKTTLAKYFINSLTGLESSQITSPTFSLVNVYNATCGEIWHADLYRLKDICEVEELGLLEAVYNNICFIEWPEVISHILPKRRRTDIYINIANQHYRELKVHQYL